MVLPCEEQQQEEKQPVSSERQLSIVNDGFEDIIDYDEEIEKKAACYDCVQPDQLENGFLNNPNFGNIAIVDSTHCHIGNKTYYQGPVTVLKQIVVPPLREKQRDPDEPIVKTEVPAKTDANEKCIEKVCHLDLCQGPTKRRVIAAGITAVISGLLAATVYLIIYQMANNSKDPSQDDGSLGDTGDGSVSDLYPNNNGTTPILAMDTLRVWNRSYWLAQPPVDVLDDLTLPVQYVIITHSATESCFTTADCIGRVRSFQRYHIDVKEWPDIGYNFLVGGNGEVFEGRGWDKVGAHTYGWNRKSIGICDIGNFDKYEPRPAQIMATQKLIEQGVALGKIAPDYKLLAHRQVSATESPGRNLYKNMSNWPHWYSGPIKLLN